MYIIYTYIYICQCNLLIDRTLGELFTFQIRASLGALFQEWNDFTLGVMARLSLWQVANFGGALAISLLGVSFEVMRRAS